MNPDEPNPSNLSDEELVKLTQEYARLSLFDSPADFAKALTAVGEVKFQWNPYRHLMLLNEKVLDLLNPLHPSRRLLVTMPPQHGKSLFCSLYLPAWFLTKFPMNRVMVCSYADDYAMDWGREIRNLISANQELLGISIAPDSKSAGRWSVKGTQGGLIAAGVGGQITGRGAHLMVVDDPFKDHEDADSPTIREKRWLWWNGVAQTRLRQGAVAIMIQTRWHEDDLAGRVLSHEPDKWVHVNLPAIAEDTDDALGRTPGEVLCPELFSSSELAMKKESMISRVWTSLYQQRPSPESGGFFNRNNFRYWTPQPSTEKTYILYDKDGSLLVPQSECWRFITMDLASTTKTYSDYTVACVWDAAPYLKPSRLILVDVIREQIEGAGHVDLGEKLWRKYRPSFVAVEEAQQGSQTLSFLRRQNVIVRGLKHKNKDKVFRAMDAALLVENNRVYFPKKADWLPRWESELLSFPTGTHDDQVDAFAYAAMEILRGVNLAKRKTVIRTPTVEERCWAQVTGRSTRQFDHEVTGVDW